jgi:hypothetical protein
LQFWIGPLLGATAAALIYKYAFRHPDAIAEDERAEAALLAAEKLAQEEVAAELEHKAVFVGASVSSKRTEQRVTSSAGTGTGGGGVTSGSSTEWPEASSSYRAVADAAWHADGSGGDLSGELLRAR